MPRPELWDKPEDTTERTSDEEHITMATEDEIESHSPTDAMETQAEPTSYQLTGKPSVMAVFSLVYYHYRGMSAQSFNRHFWYGRSPKDFHVVAISTQATSTTNMLLILLREYNIPLDNFGGMCIL